MAAAGAVIVCRWLIGKRPDFCIDCSISLGSNWTEYMNRWIASDDVGVWIQFLLHILFCAVARLRYYGIIQCIGITYTV